MVRRSEVWRASIAVQEIINDCAIRAPFVSHYEGPELPLCVIRKKSVPADVGTPAARGVNSLQIVLSVLYQGIVANTLAVNSDFRI